MRRLVNLVCVVTFLVGHAVLTVKGIDAILKPLQQAYDEVFQEFGEQYMKRIDFVQTKYDDEPSNEEICDFIIVGSGPGGSSVANRLSEIEKWKICLLEAGEAPSVLNDVPFLAGVWSLTNYSWFDLMEPDGKVGLGMVNQQIYLPRGKGLGGSSLLNFMIFTRGNSEDYDKWANLGNPGWSYKDVLKYFRKLEKTLVKEQDQCFRGLKGPVDCSDVFLRSPISQVYVNAAQELGDKYVDYNGKSQMGVSFIQASVRNGLRVSAEKAYLRPAKDRKNLKILTRSTVTSILTENSKHPRATGVKFLRDGKEWIAKARKEVIISAGSFNSPKLLMLSGIGPKKDLETLGIPLVKDLPVGQTLYDHFMFFGNNFELNTTVAQVPPSLKDQVRQITFNGTSRLASIIIEAIRFKRTTSADKMEKPTYPNMEVLFWPADGAALLQPSYRFSDDLNNNYWKPIETNTRIWRPLHTLLRPKSKGFVTLRSKDPMSPPKIVMNYLSDQQDIRNFIESIRDEIAISNTENFQKFNSTLLTMPVPGCNFEFESDAYWECALRTLGTTLHHPTSTCKMGPKSDAKAVVDNRCRVHGVQNLRVIDASVIPIPLAAHTMVPTYMVGERTADFIKEDYGYI